MKKAAITEKMIGFYNGDQHAIQHFLKVAALAAALGELEGLDGGTLDTLEIAAIVHDIACPLCREKYGSAAGNLQEAESEALLRPFLAEFALPDEKLERVVWLVCHHHTYTNVDGADHRLLLEADWLVNAGESPEWRNGLDAARETVFRSEAGLRLLDSMFS